MLPLFAWTLGLFINYITWGLPFFSLLCVFAGLFLIMPALLKFDVKDFYLLKEHKNLVIINICINFILVPIIFFWIWSFAFSETSITYAYLLLWFLSWGGMLLHWIGKNSWDQKLWFLLFMLNLVLFSVVIFYPLNSFLQAEWTKYSLDFLKSWGGYNCVFSSLTGGYISCVTKTGQISPLFSLFVLTIFPFILSRGIRMNSFLYTHISKHIQKISEGAIFIVIFYIFSLKQVHTIFSLSPSFLGQVLLTTALSYVLVYGILFTMYIYLWKKKEHMSLFWVGATRFITLWLVFSFVYSTFFWTKFLVVFVIAYIIQIPFSLIMTRIFPYLSGNSK